ncbi:alpha/beta fold hydrolase (plasmid) [Rhizobium leguminosarum]
MNIVLVPGFMATKSLWDDVISDLEKIGPITHANLCDGTSIRDIAQRAITHAPESFALIGFSMGGYMAREIARIASSRVEALVLIATSARADTPEQIIRKASASEQLRVSRFAGLSRATILQSLHPRNANNIAMVERVRRMSLDLGKDVFIRQVALERDGDLDRLGEIVCPTLVVAAAQDKLRSLPEAEELRTGIPHAELVIVKESGHMLPIEAPGALTGLVVPWLRKLRTQLT